MTRRVLTAALLVLGLTASPVLPLYCVGGDEAQAADCCREATGQCNRPGMSDDCCRTAPGAGDGEAPAAELTAAAAQLLDGLAPVTVASMPPTVMLLEASAPVRGRAAGPIPAATPPPLSALRI